jgi:hypothetical protein
MLGSEPTGAEAGARGLTIISKRGQNRENRVPMAANIVEQG